VSLSTRTALVLTLFAVLCAGGTGALVYSLSRVGYEEIVLDRQRLLAQQGAAAFLDDVELATQELEHVSRMVEVDLDDDDDAAERRVLNEAWRLTLFFFEGIVLLVDEEGKCHGAEPDSRSCADKSYADEAWFIEGKKTRKPAVLFEARPGSSGAMNLVVPMIDENGDLEGMLLGEIELGRGDLFDESVRGSGPAPEQLLLLGPSGQPLFADGEPALDSEPWQNALESLQRGEARATRTEVGDVTHVLAWAPVGRTGAGLVYVWRWNELDPHGDSRARGLVVATVVMAMLGMAVGVLLARRITGPMLALAADIREARTQGMRIEPGAGGDEVAELRRAFAALVDALAEREAELRRDRDRIAELADTLEERVEERTNELDKARDALIEAERLATLGRAGAALSHELRNSLNALSVGIDALGSGVSTEAALGIRQHVRSEIGRLRSLSDMLLDFARPRKLNPRRTSAGELLGRSLALVEDHAADLGVTISLDDDDPEAVLEVDPDLLQSVFSNLVRNAVDAVAALPTERRRVAVRARTEADGWRVIIEDAGEGIVEAVKPQLFQPFVSGRPGGVGLGLSVARRFVELHGGMLDLAKGEDLGGACFVVRLPCHQAKSEKVA
jgi:signal transduction histidine kinase